jgi:hypothetical protein
MEDMIILGMMMVLLVGSLIYRGIANDRDFRKAHNKNKKKKFHI